MASRSPRLPSASKGANGRPRPTRLASLGAPGLNRRSSVSGLTPGAPKYQRTSKTSQKLVVLPSAPQTRPLLAEYDEDLTLGHETDAGVREYKSQAERMTKDQRKKAGFKRITAYCVAESLKMKLLSSFLKREHNVSPRVFDEALYVMYHLPLLPGYGPDTNIRSSVPPKVSKGKSFLARLSEAEETGYQGTYFTSPAARSVTSLREGYISSNSPVDTRKAWPVQLDSPNPDVGLQATPSSEIPPTPMTWSETEPEGDTGTETENDTERNGPRSSRPQSSPQQQQEQPDDDVAEVIFFEYGVIVFFGLEEEQEKDILEDISGAGIPRRRIQEESWEIEECHFAHDPHISYPRIYNDFFTLKSRSHLLKLSIAHALAQSTLLAHYETNASVVLSSPLARSIPQQLATSGRLHLRRHDAMKLTGSLFKLRRDVNLVSNVLDVPGLFWSEASLRGLYDAVREYMEIGGRVQGLNEKLGVASDFLDAIHDHLNDSAMVRITWIIIWLIAVAILVEVGEIMARLVVHSTLGERTPPVVAAVLSKEDVLRTLEKMMTDQSP